MESTAVVFTLQRVPSLLVKGLFLVFLPFLWAPSAYAKKKKVQYLWDDYTDGIYSLNVTSVAIDPTNPKRIYAASNGILYVSQDEGFTWDPLARFSGSTRGSVNHTSVNLQKKLDELKESILEEKIEDLSTEIGEELAREARPQLEREAEEEARDRLRGSVRSNQIGSLKNRFRRFIYRIAISPQNPKLILLATDGGGFLSTDGGKTFNSTLRGRGGGPEGHMTRALIHPTNSKRMLLGSQRGLWYTNDGGKNWNKIFGKLRTLAIREIRRDPSNPKRIYVATPRAIFVSKDGGKSFREHFTLTSSGPQRITALAILKTTPKITIMMGTGNGIYRSVTPDARRFKPARSLGIGVRTIKYLTNSPSVPNNLYAITPQGVFISTNQGRRFRQLRTAMTTQNIRYITVEKRDPLRIWAATDYGLLRWTKVIGGRITKAKWKRFQKKLRREPNAWRLSYAALKYMRLNRRLGGLFSRYKLRGLMPNLQVQGYINLDRDQRNLILPTILPVRVNEGRQFIVRANLVWNFSELAYVRSESSVYGQMINLRRLRDKVITQVVRLINARRRIQLLLFSRPPKDPRRYLRRYIKLQELTAHLDALSGGYLSKRLKRFR
ncbi:MAG TPA: hypothetical protein DCE42_00555 [Myxococcales bacterium]|nr:hypothetical protein [Deltaproteobacteria bacterium]MBU51324.1 hypothetical protein [Deltaproteobacteria bacterium]HAA53209.1 hypothetical protein [Myxococcales bacterium]